MATETPTRSTDQRLEALKMANHVRTERAGVKRRLKMGESAIPLVLDPPEDLQSMKAKKLLLALRQVGPVRANKILRVAGCAPSKSLAGLSERQRHALAAELEKIGR